MVPYKGVPPYNVDPYILDPTKMDMIQNSDEENRQEVVDLLCVSMHAMLMTTYKWKIKKFELKESCNNHGFAWPDVDDLMRFWCQISKTRIHDDIYAEWIGYDEQIMVDDDESSSVQPASSNITIRQTHHHQATTSLPEEVDPSPPGNNITDGVVFVQSS